MCDIVPSNIIVAGVDCGVDCGRTRVGLSVGIFVDSGLIFSK